jgi:hypothetical protein
MNIIGAAIPLTKTGFNSVVNYLKVEKATVWAVIYNESICGYLPNRKPIILFERHKFHNLTHGQFDNKDSSISLVKPGGYGSSGDHQYARLESAATLDKMAAFRSASWGLTQIMGYYAEELGYMNVYSMVNAFAESEDNQLYAFSHFCYKENLVDFLRDKDWEGFSRKYNGAGYKINKYDTRLEANYKKFSKRAPDIEVRAKQVMCYFNNLLRLYDIDGIDGPVTQGALKLLNLPTRTTAAVGPAGSSER